MLHILSLYNFIFFLILSSAQWDTFSLNYGWNVSGPLTQSFASVLYPPAWYIGLDNDNRTLNFPQLDLDWQFVYRVMAVKPEDWMLEVRLTVPKVIWHRFALYYFFLGCGVWRVIAFHTSCKIINESIFGNSFYHADIKVTCYIVFVTSRKLALIVTVLRSGRELDS